PSSGGDPTSYVVTPYIGSAAQSTTTVNGTPPATGATINGLTAGTQYTFTVRGVNGNGSGPDSANSNAVTPTGTDAPSTPTGVSATPGSNSALVTWTAPSDNGGSSLTGYTVTPFVGSQAQTAVQVAADKTSATVGNLTNGTGYTFKVTATNAIGSTTSD